MSIDDWEYDPAYQEAYKGTFEYQSRQLGYALGDTGNEIAKRLMSTLTGTSLFFRAFMSEVHVNEVMAMSRLRRYWHFLTGHRR